MTSNAIIDLIKASTPHAHTGALVLLSDLRASLGITGQDWRLDSLLWSMVRGRQITVQRHGSPHTLSDAQRAACLRDADGHYYHCLALRV